MLPGAVILFIFNAYSFDSIWKVNAFISLLGKEVAHFHPRVLYVGQSYRIILYCTHNTFKISIWYSICKGNQFVMRTQGDISDSPLHMKRQRHVTCVSFINFWKKDLCAIFTLKIYYKARPATVSIPTSFSSWSQKIQVSKYHLTYVWNFWLEEKHLKEVTERIILCYSE